jgi:hypothetical protein
MRRPRPALLGAVGLMGLGSLGLALMGLLACGPSAEDIAEARARDVAALDGFVVRQEPVLGADPSGAPRLERLAQDVALDLVIRRGSSEESPEGLPGITLDVDQVDAAGTSRRHWRVWIETAGLAPAGELRAEQVLEDVDFAPGDGFRVEVRRDIPAAERANYVEWREPDAATSGGPAS